MIEIHRFPTLSSTSTYIADHASELPSGYVAVTPCQTAGRGQRGNSWESEPGKNVTFSMLWRPDGFPARRQFRLSQAVSMAIVDAIREVSGVDCSVKWPNDIYAGDRKICGILISHALAGAEVMHTIIGAGINVNQTRFISDAPNPVSLAQLTGRNFDVEELLSVVLRNIEASLNLVTAEGGDELIHSRYMECLWRGGEQPHNFRDLILGDTFPATVYAIEPLGHLVLRESVDGTLRRYAFKEVEWLS